MPNVRVKPMLAHLGTQEDLTLADYIYEPKIDGIRALCYVNSSMTFFTRNNIDITSQYPELNIRPAIQAKTAILDGEIFMYNKHGYASFSLLQNRKQLSSDQHATYVVFDILMRDGKNLFKVPLSDRKKILEDTIAPIPGLLEVIVFTKNGLQLWKVIKKYSLEGVVAKKINSLYHPGKRLLDWIKIKITQSADCVILGFTHNKRLISSLVLGVYDQGVLTEIGKVGTGFDQELINDLYKKFIKIERKTPPCPSLLKDIRWLSPRYVAEIKYAEWTKDHKLRAPVFLRLRSDKKPRECTFDQ